ncbi:DUF2017 family protein [Saccharothrix violaceirubra]|nr:hypothetical protein [Saccharothrix violaceirubra]
MDVFDVPESDCFDAVRAVDGIVVRMSATVATVLAHRIGDLLRYLEHGVLPDTRWRRGRTDPARARMFGDIHEGRAQSRRFREEYRDRLCDTGPALRVLERCQGVSPFVLRPAEVDDWVATIGLPGRRRHPRGERDDVNWFGIIVTALVVAADPGLFAGPPVTG